MATRDPATEIPGGDTPAMKEFESLLNELASIGLIHDWARCYGVPSYDIFTTQNDDRSIQVTVRT